ncbi:NifB/NifX family molybdenum-iron cluster-binding protein [Ruminococcaceae bacterium OttesenSCG-928-L11]|nr:NifB/NifX family molybdenum-iron cluster-binding protein [Ruminococcaceae bacterium OttesenSCG-928-L11]
MRIATTYEAGNIFQHFGRTEQFKVYDIADGKVQAAAVIGTNGKGHGALADVLKEEGVDTLICGGIGEGAQNMLAAAGIKLYGGVSGSADEAIAALLAGRLLYNPDVACGHHGDHDHHGCHNGQEEHGCSGEHH